MIGKRVMERAEAAFEPRPVGANAAESQHQYANLYFQRLVAQRPRVEAELQIGDRVSGQTRAWDDAWDE